MSQPTSTRVRLDLFDATAGLTRGRGMFIEAFWYGVKCAVFTTSLPWPSAMKVALLRRFGAQIGLGVVIKPRVNIHFPWKLTVGDHCWLGEGSWILNLAPVSLGAHVCISQNAFLCTGNHDFRQPHMPYRNAPITIEDGAWIAAQTFVGPGVTVGRDTVVLAGSVVLKSLDGGNVYQGSPCVLIGPRWPQPTER
jgi:putative colanic acid biosynthesis acetyltransferase WcaF